MRYSFNNTLLFVVLCVGVAIRGIVSLGSYSGAQTPPMYGDYEAQRHWQEITFNLPTDQWYKNTTQNDLLYWGIDYPPLTAYHSLILGFVANRINSSYVQLFYSRGLESIDHKSFMRLSVLVGDLIVYLPAAVMVMISLESTASRHVLSSLAVLIFYPCQILIDNGHFQYNNISLGLFLFSVASILQSRYNWASLTFSLALNFKQMELYHALPIFIYLLKTSFSKKSLFKNICSLTEVGCITVITFTLVWMPWISSIDTFMATVFRLFPLNRGVFEDKVANVWCSLNAIYKLKENLSNEHMALICLTATLLAVSPTNVHLLFHTTKKTFLYALVNTSLAFFLLSFQVHEKSILLAAVPICFLFEMMPFGVLCFLKLSTLSVFPLLIRDNLSINYFCLTISYMIIFKYLIQLVYSKDKKTQQKLIMFMDLLDAIVLSTSLATLLLPTPERLPYLWSFVISFFCCIFFIIFLVRSNILQYHSFLTSFKYFKAISSDV